ncbi:MAG: hypothetical protein AB1782_01010, partial [Cyanobacteriota bacterium]
MNQTADKKIYAGLFLVTMATLMLEILLTRIYSVTMYYHYAFLAISIVMFGMTIGAVIVYILPESFKKGEARTLLSKNAYLFSVSIFICFLFHMIIPFSL